MVLRVTYSLFKESFTAFAAAAQLEPMFRSLVPAGAWDTHIHIFEPSKHSFSDSRSYTPAPASLDQYPTGLTGCENVVIVLGTVQGTNNSNLIDVLTRDRSGQDRIISVRGLAVLDLENTTDEYLDDLHTAGVRGVRLHEVSWGFGNQIDDAAVARKLRYTAARVARLSWVIDVYVHPKTWMALAETIDDLPPATKILGDHWCCLRPGEEESDACLTILDLVRRGRIFVKLSSSERQCAQGAADIRDMEKLARLFIEAGPDRLLFGSDWPHTNWPSVRQGKTREERLTDVEEFRQVDLARHVDYFRRWISNEEVWENLWLKTPTKLFA